MIDLPTEPDPVRIVEGDALACLRALSDASVDSVVTDPPYPCIKREYGYWTEAEWFALMNPVVEECRRVLKPTGSAVFVLQPNSERVGRMRTWLWEFMADWGKRWGIVQDAWWWNHCAPPGGGEGNRRGLLRPSLKACVWLGAADCYRDQLSVLWDESERNKAMRLSSRALRISPSGFQGNDRKIGEAALRRGGVTPFNVFPTGGCNRWGDGGGAHGHGASTPPALCRWWIRYICPPDGIALDPFTGSGTVPLAALAEGRKAIGIERFPKYVAIARKRVAECLDAGLFAEVG